MRQLLARPAERAPGAATVALFSATLFLSAGLMFLVQPMFAKLMLPLFGSTPAVWNASMLFFQTALLGGYLYAHESTRRLGVRRQAALHVGVLLLPLLVLPIGLPADWTPPTESNPVPALLGLMAVAIGLPFFVVSTTAPLLQRWLAGTSHPAARDPYFLYRASNLGSVIGLLAYPAAVEPSLRLDDQGWLWSGGYVLLVVLVLACAVVVWRERPVPRPQAAPAETPPAEHEQAEAPDGIGLVRRLRWVGLAFVPSSLMLGVTTTITADIAPLPLLWALPLSLYLASFILVFAPGARNARLHGWMVSALPGVVLLLLLMILLEARHPLWLVLPLHLAGFFVAAMVCHGELARDRPPARSLTEFYLLVSLGGALGGVFNAIVAPGLLDSFAEYPLAIVLAALCLPGRPPRIPPSRYARLLDFALPLAFALPVALIVAGISLGGSDARDMAKVIAFGTASGIAVNFVRRPLRFGLTIGAIVLAVVLAAGTDDEELHRERSFFGVYTVTASDDGRIHELVHGTTTHGRQDLRRERTPVSYYHGGSPIGRLMKSVPASATRRVGVIGLGTGSIACWARPGERWTFYEIDPTVERMARDPRLFTYMRVCPGTRDVVLGDARLSLRRAPARGYGMIVGDAFSSDSIPVHLLTREALTLYRSKLHADGLIAVNVSNRYLTLQPVLGNLARDAGLACVTQEDARSEDDGRPETDASDWVVMADRERTLRTVAPARDGWEGCPAPDGTPVWTDDFSNLLGVVDLDG